MSDRALIDALEEVDDAMTALMHNHFESLDITQWVALEAAWMPFSKQLCAEAESLRHEERARLAEWNEVAVAGGGG